MKKLSNTKFTKGSLNDFIRLVEPLIEIANIEKIKLRCLAIQALVNLTTYSDDAKEIFVQKNGIKLIEQSLLSKQ